MEYPTLTPPSRRIRTPYLLALPIHGAHVLCDPFYVLHLLICRSCHRWPLKDLRYPHPRTFVFFLFGASHFHFRFLFASFLCPLIRLKYA